MNPVQLLEETRQFIDQSHALRAKFRARYAYYHRDTLDFLQNTIQPDSRILLIGCDTKDIAAHLQCAFICWMELALPEETRPLPSHVKRVADLEEAFAAGPFDYILLPFTLQFLQDIQAFLERLYPKLHANTRLIIVQYNFLWAPLIKLAQKISLRVPYPTLNWLNRQDIRNLFTLCNFQEITSGARCLLPLPLPGLTWFCNRFLAPLPGLQWLCQKTHVVARPLYAPSPQAAKPTVSIIVPARNEAGNIAPLLDRLPALGSRCELIFVEGHSRDHTWPEIQKQMLAHPRRKEFDIKAVQQTGIGKADASRLGFSQATGDVLMILDADLSVRPEDLAHFYEAVVRESAEFLNGSRLVYQMEKQAMQILNLFFNKLFGLWLSWLIGQPVKDTLCGTKVLLRKNYLRIRNHYPDLEPMDPFGDFELLFGASRLSLKICDVPVRYQERTYGSTNIRRFRDGWRLLKICLKAWKQKT